MAREHAGFSTQSARATTDVIPAYRIVLACELVAAVRALRLRGIRPAGRSLADAFELAAGALPAQTSDRPLDGDVVTAQRLLPELAALLPPERPAPERPPAEHLAAERLPPERLSGERPATSGGSQP